MKYANKLITSAVLSVFLISTQTAMALDEEQEIIPPPSSHETQQHEHKLGNAENGTDLMNDKASVAENDDDHHDKKSLDDTTK